MRYRDLKLADLDRSRDVVRAWREEHPEGTAEELIAAVDGQFHREWLPTLRATLIAVDRHRARTVTGIATGPEQTVR